MKGTFVKNSIHITGALEVDPETNEVWLKVKLDLPPLLFQSLLQVGTVFQKDEEEWWRDSTLEARRARKKWYKDAWGVNGHIAMILASFEMPPSEVIELPAAEFSMKRGVGPTRLARIMEAIQENTP